MEVPLTSVDRRRVEALRRWAGLLDSAFGIPGTRVRFGVDAILGLVPGLGDAFSGVFSLILIVHAARLGLPRIVLARMGANVLIDVLIGVIPLAGDLFDVAWKANLRNVALVERFVGGGRRSATSADYLFVGGLVLVLLLALVIPLWMLLALLHMLDRPLV